MASNQMLQLITENLTLKATISTLKGELSSVNEQFVTIKSGLAVIKAKMFRDEALRVSGLIIEALRLRTACYALPSVYNPTTDQGKNSIESAKKTTTGDLLKKAKVRFCVFLL